MTLLERVYSPENLRVAALAVARAMRQGLSAVPRPRSYYRDMERLSSTPDKVAADIRAAMREQQSIRFSRRVSAIPKRPGGKPERPISLFSIETRVVFRSLLTELWPLIEPIIEPSVAHCTFRKDGLHPPRGITMAVTSLRDERKAGVYVFETDISGFFDTVDREKLFEVVKPYLGGDESADQLIRAVLTADTLVDPRTMTGIEFDPDTGVPQGSALSPLLACAYLSPFDRQMDESGYRMIRYVDDVVVLCSSREECEQIEMLVREILDREYKLKLKDSKTHPVPPDEDLLFLGHVIHPDGRLLPSPKRMERLAAGVYERVGLLPGNDGKVAETLTSYLLGFFRSMSHCDFQDAHYRDAARLVKRALVARGLDPNRLTHALARASKKWPAPFMEELRCQR